MKKILFHINSLGKGGAEKVVSVLSKYFVAEAYDVIIVTLWRAEDEYVLDEGVRRINIQDIYQDKRMGRLKKAVSRMIDFRKLLQEEKPDIVISFCNKANFRCAYSMLGMKTPLITSVRNDPKKDYAPYRLSMKMMEHKASGCVFQTPDAMACFSKEFQKKSCIIWNPVDEKYIGTSKTAVRTGDIVSVGRFSVQKNHMLLLRAYNRIRSKFPETTLKFYGEESEAGQKDILLSYVKEQGMESQVCFMGQSNQLEKEITNASLFVLPSDYEGMPNALVEAMVMGLPVIATDCPCGGPAELIENGKSGLLVPVGDEEKLAKAMERLLTDTELAEILGRNAEDIIAKVHPQSIYVKWKCFVEELIEKPISSGGTIWQQLLRFISAVCGKAELKE